MKMSKSTLRIMNAVWEKGCVSAKDIADELKDLYGWNKNTTYTVIKQCVKKGLIERVEPGFMCCALVSRTEVQTEELNELVERVFKGAPKLLFSTLLKSDSLSQKDIEELEQLISKLK